ncbi:sodium channel protein Nach [Anabrus simplex]|uniref:sodium channel protein Nach n=1 Tax=Anabrus simplex TaxID=316456 RepID=UPI0035A3555F
MLGAGTGYYNTIPETEAIRKRFPNNSWRTPANGYNDKFNQINSHVQRSTGSYRDSKTWKYAVEAFEFFYLFLETSSIHGLNHLTTKNRTVFEYVVWFIFLCLAIWGCATISLSTLRRYEENPTVISMERDYKQWNTSLAAATSCTVPNYDAKAISNYVDIRFPTFKYKQDLKEYFQNLTMATYDNFKYLREIYGNPVKSEEYQELVYNNFQKKTDFSSNVSNSRAEWEIAEVVSNFNERGICYTYSTAVGVYNRYSYWKDNSWKIIEPGILYYGNPLDGYRFFQWFFSSSAMIYVHSSYEIPDAAKRGYELKYSHYMSVTLMALSIYSTEEVKSLRIKQRKCRFLHESNLRISPVYTYNMCRMQCRMDQAKRVCNCVPYFYRRVDKSTPVCDAAGMLCLSKHEESLVKFLDPRNKTRKLNCDCYPPCDDVNYMLDEESQMHWSQATTFKWGMSKYPHMRLKRDILFGFTDLLVSIGGTAGLFLGCSVLSFMEIFYFFTLRLFWFIMKRKQQPVK